jgi:hypothetical protein
MGQGLEDDRDQVGQHPRNLGTASSSMTPLVSRVALNVHFMLPSVSSVSSTLGLKSRNHGFISGLDWYTLTRRRLNDACIKVARCKGDGFWEILLTSLENIQSPSRRYCLLKTPSVCGAERFKSARHVLLWAISAPGSIHRRPIVLPSILPSGSSCCAC